MRQFLYIKQNFKLIVFQLFNYRHITNVIISEDQQKQIKQCFSQHNLSETKSVISIDLLEILIEPCES